MRNFAPYKNFPLYGIRFSALAIFIIIQCHGFSILCAGVAVPSAVEMKELQQFPVVKEVLL